MNRTAGMAVGLAALLLAMAAAHAGEADGILAKYVAWRGGARFEALRSVHERGHIRVGEVDGTYERWLGRDGRLRQDQHLGPLAASEAVTPDANWTTNASGQLESLGDGGRGDRRRLALAFRVVGGRDSGMTHELLAPEQYEGSTCAVVRVRFDGNDTFDLLLDPATGALLAERITEDRATRLVRYAGWRMVHGVRMPFEVQTTSANPAANETRRAEVVQVNTTLPASLFARPASKRLWKFTAGNTDTGWIPFEFYNQEQIFVPATVNGRKLSLILDTGADISILDQATASGIGVSLSGALPVGGTGGQATMQLASGVTVTIGNLALSDITAGVMDLSGMAGQLGHAMPMILGKEIFNELIVDLDFPNRRIAFHDPGHFAVPAGAVRVALGRHGENRTVPVSIEGREPIDFDFDLGNNSPVIIYPHYRDSARLLAQRRQSRSLSAGVGGIFSPACATLASITIGGLGLADVPADFPEPADSALNSDRSGGNIGLPVFSRFRLVTDYARDAIWLVRDGNAAARPFPRNRAGLIATAVGDRLRVLLVAPGSPAEQDGWKQGAEIVAVDGHPIDAGYRASPQSQWTTQAAGTRVALTLADGSTRTLVLADYF
jgi:hypothetical protein